MPATEEAVFKAPTLPEPETLGSSPVDQTIAEPILQVEIDGVRSPEGVYSCALFNSESTWKQREGAVAAETLPVEAESVVWTVDTLAPGEYAIAVFHDANENEVLDRHSLGFPIEAYGFSNNARGKFGPPPYEKITFRVEQDPVKIKIQLK